MKRLFILLSLLLCALPVRATIARVQAPTAVTTTTGVATSLAQTLSATGAGNTLVCGITSSATMTFTGAGVTDNGSTGSTYVERSSNDVSGHAYIWTATGIVSGITQVTAAFSSGPSVFLSCAEYSGVSGLGQLTKATAASGATSATNTLNMQSANNWLVSVFWITAGGGSLSASTGTLLTSSTAFDSVGMADNSGTTVYSALSDTVTWGTAEGFLSLGIELSTSPVNVTQFFGTNATATTVAQAFTFPNQAGEYVIGGGYDGGGASENLTFTDGGDTFTQLTPTTGGTAHAFCALATDGDTVGASFAKVGTTGTKTITMANGGTSTGKRLLIVSVSGLVASSVLDQTSTCVDSGASNVTTQTTGSVTTTAANEIIIGFFGSSSNLNTYTAGTNFAVLNQIPSGAGTGTTVDEYRLLSSTSSYTASITSNVSSELAGFAATFKAPAASQNFNVSPTETNTTSDSSGRARGQTIKLIQSTENRLPTNGIVRGVPPAH